MFHFDETIILLNVVLTNELLTFIMNSIIKWWIIYMTLKTLIIEGIRGQLSL